MRKQKALELFLEVKCSGAAMLYVGHDFSEILRLCDRMLLLEGGRALFLKSLTELPDSPLELEELVRSLLPEEDAPL